MMAEIEIQGLNNPIYTSLSGLHSEIAQWRGKVARYPDDSAYFFGLPDDPTKSDWADAAQLLGDRTRLICPIVGDLPPNWNVLESYELLQLVAPPGFGRLDEQVVSMDQSDVPDMLVLTEAADGNVSFEEGALRLGEFVGIREGGLLVAMGGERFRGPGWTELSGGCVARDRRRRGLGTRVLRHRAAVVEARDELPILMVLRTNPAARMFLSLGWQHRAQLRGALVQHAKD